MKRLATLLLLSLFLLIPATSHAILFNSLCPPPFGCQEFGGRVVLLAPVFPCGELIFVVGPKPIVGSYIKSKYIYPLIPTLGGPPYQQVIGYASADPFTALFCPPFVIISGASLPAF